jgi:hypothetical protein
MVSDIVTRLYVSYFSLLLIQTTQVLILQALRYFPGESRILNLKT